jgi:hypothetical protein
MNEDSVKNWKEEAKSYLNLLRTLCNNAISTVEVM